MKLPVKFKFAKTFWDGETKSELMEISVIVKSNWRDGVVQSDWNDIRDRLKEEVNKAAQWAFYCVEKPKVKHGR